MLKKRLVGVITVKDGWAVQSFGYNRYLPLGHPESLAENLDRWNVDEILILSIDRGKKGLGPDISLIQRLAGLGLSTPLTYGGGIRSSLEAIAVIQAGAERITVDAALRGSCQDVRNMSQHLGAQAIIAAIPVSIENGDLSGWDYREGKVAPFDKTLLTMLRETTTISEVLLIDRRNEGFPNSFDDRIIGSFPVQEVPLIVFGGLSEASQIRKMLSDSRIAAVGIGNFLSYSEHAVQHLKKQLTDLPVRDASFQSSCQ